MKNSSARVCFIGTGSGFSFTALKTLCEHNVTITEIILAGHAPAALPKTCLPVSANRMPDTQDSSVQQLAGRHAIPLTYLGHAKDRQQQWRQLCTDAKNHPRPDFVFVACFPEKLPSVLLSWPHEKSINLHPSLLPRYRGPDPVFWQLHNNEKHTGISLHILSSEFDAGPILYQHEVSFPVSAIRSQLDKLLAQEGALAFIHLLTTGEFVATEQDATQATHQALPGKNNRELSDKSL